MYVNSHKQRAYAQNGSNRFRLQGFFSQAHLCGMLKSEYYFRYKVLHFNNKNAPKIHRENPTMKARKKNEVKRFEAMRRSVRIPSRSLKKNSNLKRIPEFT